MTERIAELANMLGYTSNEKGRWSSPNGSSIEPTARAVLEDVLDFCGCGLPGAALSYVFDGLRLIYDFENPTDHMVDDAEFPEFPPRRSTGGHGNKDFEARWKEESAARKAHFGTDGAAYSFWYGMDRLDLLEHGGGLPGWLTAKGRTVMALLVLDEGVES